MGDVPFLVSQSLGRDAPGHGSGSQNLSDAPSSTHGDPGPSSTVPASAPSAQQSPLQPLSILCAECKLPVTGKFAYALDGIFHLDCFTCEDCHAAVAESFFVVETADGARRALCERDYFRRLDLLCAQCGGSLRDGAYVAACGRKFHAAHFTCSVCPRVFGPHDTYYEHGGAVYCRAHYARLVATRCTGCDDAILEQYVEVSRNLRDECWHTECYAVWQAWAAKVAPRRPRIN